jgi:hypothetical protein
MTRRFQGAGSAKEREKQISVESQYFNLKYLEGKKD